MKCNRARRSLFRGVDTNSIMQQCSWAGCKLIETLQVSLHKNPQLIVQVIFITDSLMLGMLVAFITISLRKHMCTLVILLKGIACVHCSCIARPENTNRAMLRQCNAGDQPKYCDNLKWKCSYFVLDHTSIVITIILNIFQAAQLLVSDWLLETRTALWEKDFELHKLDPGYVAPLPVLTGFQDDLSSLKKLVQHLPVSYTVLLMIHLNTE